MKIVEFRYDPEIITTLSIGYDACRLPRPGIHGQVTKIQKKLRARRGLERPQVRVLRIGGTIFMVRV